MCRPTNFGEAGGSVDKQYLLMKGPKQIQRDIRLEQFARPCAREERISPELILKPELVLSNTEKSHHFISFRTGSSKNAVRHKEDPASQFERCPSVRH
ncbi:hypothetical protein Mal48_07660 [Thalassoglobus polymorphus]|uniref:Uncharacterized protein n=1 Tax=Thalassoglobus polymorphus TaxID=2527994 RepID=A0A517QIQ1_9PLAN|nr:hypothetical protein Mal48_07660 [Thalassoglobus polymorphus]